MNLYPNTDQISLSHYSGHISSKLLIDTHQMIVRTLQSLDVYLKQPSVYTLVHNFE